MAVPQKLNDRHRLIALMMAMGRRETEIAVELSVSPGMVSALTRSPMFQLQLERIRKTIESEATGVFMDKVVAQAQPTLDRLTYLRDNARHESVQLGAAKSLFDAIVPKRVAGESEVVTRLVIEGADWKLMASAIAEDEGRTIDITPVEGAAGDIRPKMPEDLRTEDE